jgi:histidyl-tRNA synthetase
VIGSDSLLNEYELIRIIDDVFSRLQIKIIIKINNRKILAGLAEYIGESSRITDITIAIDKLEKIGLEAVNNELREKGRSGSAIVKLQPVLLMKGNTAERLSELEGELGRSAVGMQGISELKTLFSYIEDCDLSCSAEMDLTLARGLDYYTGAIIEVKSADVSIGSICGGGRYDNLTGVFGLEGISGVGVSFGAERIYDVMSQLGLFDKIVSSSSAVLILNFGDTETGYALKILATLRKLGIRSELYPDAVRIKKQMSYADARKIPYIIIAGEEEIRNNEITFKIMASGEQKKIPINDLEKFFLGEVKSAG